MSKSLEFLTEALRRLPGVGPKSAQRMAFHLLQHDREGADMLSRYQTDWLPDVSRLAVVNEASMPWHEWMAAFGRGMTDMAGANATQEHDHVR